MQIDIGNDDIRDPSSHAADQNLNLPVILGLIGQLIYRLVNIVKHRAQCLLQKLTLGIELDPVTAAIKQLAAQFLLQPLDGSGYGGGGDHKHLRCFAEIFVFSTLKKIS